MVSFFFVFFGQQQQQRDAVVSSFPFLALLFTVRKRKGRGSVGVHACGRALHTLLEKRDKKAMIWGAFASVERAISPFFKSKS